MQVALGPDHALCLLSAGGAASLGGTAVLDVTIDSPHQRVPFAIGSRQEVALFDRFSRGVCSGFWFLSGCLASGIRRLTPKKATVHDEAGKR